MNTWKLSLYPSIFVFSIAMLQISAAEVNAQDNTNNTLVVTFDFGDRKVPITFRNCPQGQLVPGQPTPVNSAEVSPKAKHSPVDGSVDGLVSMDEFYITETEVTTGQFAAVLGEKGFNEFRDLAKKKLTGGAEDIALLDPKGSYPVFMVGPHDAIRFCQALESANNDQRFGVSQIESRRFRLPSHYEWQYACRGRSDPAATQLFPHFHNWIEFDALPKEDQAKCLEEWQAMGRNERDFNGTQFQVMEIVVGRYSEKNPQKPLEILSAFLRESTGRRRDYSKETPGRLVPVHGTRANPWGLVEMHENVCEWTIAIADRGKLQAFWDAITSANISPEDRSNPSFFLAGGSFIDFMAGDKKDAAWAPFTIWGGKPMDIRTNTLQPFSLDEEQSKDLTFEYQPGLRIVMDRVLSNNWLLAVRSSALLKASDESSSADDLDRYRKTVMEIVPDSQQIEILSTIDFYSGLSAYAHGKPSEAAQVLGNVKDKLFKSKKKKIDLAAFGDFSTSTPPSTKPKPPELQETDDQLFQRMLQSVVVTDVSFAP